MATQLALLTNAITNSARKIVHRYTDGSAHVDASPYLVSVSPSDVTTYDPALLGIRVGTSAGAIKVRSNGIDVTIPNVQTGEIIPGNIDMVYSTDTTAVGITGWYR